MLCEGQKNYRSKSRSEQSVAVSLLYFEYLKKKKSLNLKKAAMLTLLESFVYQYVRFILYLCCLTALTKREDAQEPETVL